MKRTTPAVCALHHVIVILLLLALSSSAGIQAVDSLPSNATPSANQGGPAWQRVSLKDEEFSLLTPVQPSIIVDNSKEYTFAQDGEKVLEHRAYSAYADGFIFVVESYKASHPQKLLGDMSRDFSQLQPLEEVKVNGFSGKKYWMGDNNFFGYLYYFVTRKHVYKLRVAARDASHPSIARFLSTFSLGENSTKGDVVPKRESDLVITPEPVQAFTAKEVTRKAAVVWKAEPSYTDTARRNQRTGTVVLKAIFAATGQVVVIEVVQGLKDGLTERAIEAAKNLRFFPAEKDGRPVPQRIQIEFNFNLY